MYITMRTTKIENSNIDTKRKKQKKLKKTTQQHYNTTTLQH